MRRARGLAAVIVLALGACSATGPATATVPSSSPAPSMITYVALGASESFGIGTQDPPRESFPQQLLARLGSGATLLNLGLPFETTAAALSDELPAALAAKPDLATVFFNVDDLVAGVAPVDFAAHLDRIVGALRDSGRTRVLVAGTPPIDQLPAFAACRSGSSLCPIKARAIPSAADVRGLVAEYNDAIERVVAAHGATLVDLSAAGATLAQHPEDVGPDGFHPSGLGAAALADAFYAAWRSR